MTQDEIIRMAEEAGSHEYGPLTRNWSFELSQLERFAALVAEATKEKAAKVCEEALQNTTDAKLMLKADEVIEKAVASGAMYQAEKLAEAIRSIK